MKVCDRCKNKLDVEKESKLNGEKFELCSLCAKYISNHIKTYKPKQDGLGSLFGVK